MTQLFEPAFLAIELDYLLRLIAGAFCGAIIGLERERRFKSAGVRTHVIVALSSALMMIVSKYGFFDVVVYDSVQVDASRIAAGVISAIGFLGAGVIYVRKENTIGLTTAAGLWATVGIGITFGAGMYFLGFTSTLLIIIIQFLLHCRLFKYSVQIPGNIKMNLSKCTMSFEEVRDVLKKMDISIRSAHLSKDNEEKIITALVTFPVKVSMEEILDRLGQFNYITAVDIYSLQ